MQPPALHNGEATRDSLPETEARARARVRRRVHPLYGLLLIAAVSLGLRAWVAQSNVDDDWQPAVYRYPANGLPACVNMTGRAAPMEAPGQWSRLALPVAPQRSGRGCLLRERMTT